jgi:histidine triad (HIT) family protein
MTCVFCGIIAGTTPASIVMQDDDVVAFLDARPLFKGHVLVVPRAHIVTLPELPAASLPRFFAAVQGLARAVPAALGAEGSFVAMNNVVSQSVPHLHAHVVPRTKGDGLKGFFWPRTKYASGDERDGYAAKIAAAL